MGPMIPGRPIVPFVWRFFQVVGRGKRGGKGQEARGVYGTYATYGTHGKKKQGAQLVGDRVAVLGDMGYDRFCIWERGSGEDEADAQGFLGHGRGGGACG